MHNGDGVGRFVVGNGGVISMASLGERDNEDLRKWLGSEIVRDNKVNMMMMMVMMKEE